MDRVIRSIALVTLVSLAAASASSNAAVPPPATRLPHHAPNANALSVERVPEALARLRASLDGGASRSAPARSGVASLRLATGEVLVAAEVVIGSQSELRVQKLAADGTPLWGETGAVVCAPLYGTAAPVVLADASGGAFVAWDEPRTGEYDVFAQRFDASGDAMWAPNGVVVCDAPFEQEQPSIVSDGAGGVIIAWSDVRDGVQTDVYAQRLDMAGAAQWPANGVPLCATTGEQFGVQMLADGAGGAIAGWWDQRGADFDVYAQRLDAGGTALWAANGVGVCTSAGAQRQLGIVPCGAAGAIFTWADGDTATDVRAQRLDLTGAAKWPAAGVLVAGGIGDQTFPVAAADGFGGAVVAWTEYSAIAPGIAAQRVDSTGALAWGATGVAVCGVTGIGFAPAIASDGSGGAFVAWTDSRGATSIYAQRIDAAGAAQWTANGIAVCAAPNTQMYPAVFADGAGGAIVTWQDNRSLMDLDEYAQRLDASGTRQWVAGGAPALVCPGRQVMPEAVSLGGGRTLTAWQEKWNGVYHVRASVIDALGVPVAPTLTLSTDTTVTHVAPLVTRDGAGGGVVAWHDWDDTVHGMNVVASHVSATGVPGWSAGGVRACTNAGSQWLQSIAPDAGGGAILVWADNRNGTWDVAAQRIDAAGAVQWGANGVLVHTGVPADQEPLAISDGVGGAILGWISSGTGSPRAVAQRVDATGANLWGADGVLLCSNAVSQQGLRLASDGAGGAVFAWQDYRTGVSDIYAQRIGADGTLAWAAAGVPVCTATFFQEDVTIVPDSAHGAVIAWSDYRAVGLVGLYAQRIDASGTALWATNGVLVGADANTYYSSASLVPDGSGGAFVAWHDWRDGYADADVYAQHVSAGGAATWDASGTLVCGAPHGQTWPMAVDDGGTGIVIVWEDCRDGERSLLYQQRLDASGAALWSGGGQTPVAFALRLATVIDGRVRIEWAVSEAPAEAATVERRVAPSEEWIAVGTSRGDGTGTFAFDDADAPAGARVGYRLVFAAADGARISPAAWLDVPVNVRFAVAIAGAQPVTGALDVAVRLAAPGAVRLELVDLAGRRVLAREASLPAGGGTLRLADATQLRAGVYWLRASGAGASASRKVCVMR